MAILGDALCCVWWLFLCVCLIQFQTYSIILSVLKVSLISTKPGFVWLH